MEYWEFPFFLGGITLRFKRIGQIPFIISILFLGSNIVDFTNFPVFIKKILFCLPFTKGVTLIKQTVSINYVLNFNDSVFLLLNSLFYFIIGISSFIYYYRKSIKNGVLSKF